MVPDTDCQGQNILNIEDCHFAILTLFPTRCCHSPRFHLGGEAWCKPWIRDEKGLLGLVKG